MPMSSMVAHFEQTGCPPGLMNALIFAVIYGYFGLNFDGDPNDCYANDKSDDRVDHEADGTDTSDTQNIGAKFNFALKILFFMTLLQIFITLFAATINRKKKQIEGTNDEFQLFKATIFVYSVTSLAEVMFWIYLVIVRFTH